MVSLRLDKPNLRHIKGFIFDLDGTLVNTMPVILSILKQGLERRGARIPSLSVSYRLFGQILGSPLPQGIRMVPTLMYRVARVIGLKRLKAFFFALEATLLLRKAYDRAQLFPGTTKLLDKLRTRGFVLGLVSMGSRKGIMKILKRNGLENHFTVVISRDEVRRQKPDPEGYILAQKTMKLPPSAIIAVGDLPTDVLAASRAGMLSIGITTGIFKIDWFEASARPEAIINSLSEIERMLEN